MQTLSATRFQFSAIYEHIIKNISFYKNLQTFSHKILFLSNLKTLLTTADLIFQRFTNTFSHNISLLSNLHTLSVTTFPFSAIYIYFQPHVISQQVTLLAMEDLILLLKLLNLHFILPGSHRYTCNKIINNLYT